MKHGEFLVAKLFPASKAAAANNEFGMSQEASSINKSFSRFDRKIVLKDGKVLLLASEFFMGSVTQLFVKNAPLPTELIAHLIRDIFPALTVLHGKGLCHCDLHVSSFCPYLYCLMDSFLFRFLLTVSPTVSPSVCLSSAW